jgi:hypothetical protein
MTKAEFIKKFSKIEVEDWKPVNEKTYKILTFTEMLVYVGKQ